MNHNRYLLPLFMLIFVCTIMLSACSGGGASTTPTAATPEASPTTASTTEGGTRTFDTDKGPVEIPQHPQRIVTDYYAGELLSVGGNVIGAEPLAFDSPFIKDKLSAAQDVGAPINVEKVLELQPDLIVVMYDESYEALSKIAPTVHIPYGTTKNIQETVALFGDLMGQPDKAKEFLAEFDKKAAEGRERIKGIVDENTTVGLYELTDKGDLWIFNDNAGRGGQTVYNALGLKMPDKMAGQDQTVQLSMEMLPDYAADYMFLTFYNPENNSDALDKLKDSPVWKNLDAAKNDRLFINDFDTFYRYDPIAVMAQIDLFVDMLIEGSKQGNSK